MRFEVVSEGNYLHVVHKDEIFKLPRYFCREIGLKPGIWEIQKDADGVALVPRGRDWFEVVCKGRYLRSICFKKFFEVTGIDVMTYLGRYVLKEIK